MPIHQFQEITFANFPRVTGNYEQGDSSEQDFRSQLPKSHHQISAKDRPPKTKYLKRELPSKHRIARNIIQTAGQREPFNKEVQHKIVIQTSLNHPRTKSAINLVEEESYLQLQFW